MKSTKHQTKAKPKKVESRVHRVLIVDDHPMLRRGLAELIAHEPDLGVCGEAHDVASALEAVKATRPDLAIIDISLQDANGLELVKQLRSQHPRLAMLVCSMHDENLYAERALRAGAMGYISKERAIDDVIEAIRCVLDGKTYLSDRMADRLLSRVRGAEQSISESPVDRLSDRELEVFEQIGAGLNTNEIAQRLCLSPKTVDAHRQKVKRKLGLESTTQLTRYAVKWVLERSRGLL